MLHLMTFSTSQLVADLRLNYTFVEVVGLTGAVEDEMKRLQEKLTEVKQLLDSFKKQLTAQDVRLSTIQAVQEETLEALKK